MILIWKLNTGSLHMCFVHVVWTFLCIEAGKVEKKVKVFGATVLNIYTIVRNVFCMYKKWWIIDNLYQHYSTPQSPLTRLIWSLQPHLRVFHQHWILNMYCIVKWVDPVFIRRSSADDESDMWWKAPEKVLLSGQI